jgi:hypothetical protein
MPERREFVKGAVITMVPAAIGFLISNTVAGIVCLTIAVVSALLLWTPLGRLFGLEKQRTRAVTWDDLIHLRVPVDPSEEDDDGESSDAP